MKQNLFAFILAIVAGSLAIASFVYKLSVRHKTDYVILCAGIFVLAFGASIFFRERQ